MRTISAVVLMLALGGCAAPTGQRPDEWHDAPEGFGVGVTPFTRRVDVGDEAIFTRGLIGPRWLRLLEPEYDDVIVHSGRCVFTRRPGATTYERWRVTWPSDAAPEVDGPEPTPWRWIGELRERGTGSRPTNAVTQERDVAYGLASPEALPDSKDGALPRDVPLSILDPEGEAHGRVLARDAWIWNDTVVFDATRDGVRVTELLGLDGRRKIPPLPSVTWVNYAPAVVLDARFTGRAGLVWPLDPVTTLPVSDPTRSAIGFEPVIENTSSHVKPFWGFIKRYRTPEGQRAGWCSPDLSVDQGPVARDVVNAVENGFDGLVIERLEGGWIVCQLAHDWDGPRPTNYRIVPAREVPEATADQALAACLRERREADRLAQLEAWRRESAEHHEGVRRFEELMAAPQPVHAILDPLTEKLGAVFGVRYVLKHRPRRLEYVTQVIAQHEREEAGYGSFASDEDVAKVRAFRDELLPEKKAREDAERAELARRDAERRARDAEERRRLEEAAVAAARYEHEQTSWGGGPGETSGDRALREAAATRAATESLFRHTYGQQDWHWRQ